MSYKITVIKLDIKKAPKGYMVAEIAYKTDDGKTKGMKVLDFVQKDVFAVLKDVSVGDVLNADFEQNAKGFWQFAQLSKTGEKAAIAQPTAAAAPATRGNWETPEERFARQIFIVRQSSLTAALGYLEQAGGSKLKSPKEVIDVARVFEAYVFDDGKPAVTGEVE